MTLAHLFPTLIAVHQHPQVRATLGRAFVEVFHEVDPGHETRTQKARRLVGLHALGVRVRIRVRVVLMHPCISHQHNTHYICKGQTSGGNIQDMFIVPNPRAGRGCRRHSVRVTVHVGIRVRVGLRIPAEARLQVEISRTCSLSQTRGGGCGCRRHTRPPLA